MLPTSRDTAGLQDASEPAAAAAAPEKTERPSPGAASETVPDPGAGQSAQQRGFSLSNWFDGIHEPDWEAIGDRVMSTPSLIAAAYRKNREEAGIRAAKNAAEQEAKRLNLIEAQAQAKAEQVASDQREAEARVKAEVERVATARREAEQRAVAAKQADIEAHRLAERQRLTEFQALAANDAFLRNQGTHDAQLAEAARLAHLPPPPTSAERLEAEVAAARSAIQASSTPVYVAPYELPSTAPNPPEDTADRLRRIVVSLAALIVPAISWQWIGFKATDGGVPEGYLLTPAAEAHWIWPVIFSGFIAFALYQWFPSQRSAPRQRAVGYPAAAALLLGACWLWSSHAGFGLPALAIAVATTAVLYHALRRLNSLTARTRRERAFTDAPVALFLGWMLALTPATIAEPIGEWGPVPEILAVVVLLALMCVAAAWAMTERGRMMLALGFGWGMSWVVMARLLGSSQSVWVALAAGFAAFVVLVAAENRRYQINHAEHRAARGQRTTF